MFGTVWAREGKDEMESWKEEMDSMDTLAPHPVAISKCLV